MKNINTPLKLFISLSKTQTILNNRFDRSLGGISFNEFLILFFLSQAEGKKMRRIDIANKIGFTASGVTRLLFPMEKVHLIKNGPVEQDARVRFVQLAAGGKEKLNDAMTRLEELAEEIIPSEKQVEIEVLAKLLIEMGGRALMV